MSTPPPGGWCQPGHTMCCICFNCTPNDELYVDADGQKWDVCAVGEQCPVQAFGPTGEIEAER